ncbi:stage II sporulation protein D [Paenibacillus sp.]|uniref:stage II sporulation protein D n=1 Tax=Paenibacillus sp. TaxID=58172 RepID=UPI002D2CD012|nr:stage II sporulation protein D [Paenibacillus sp.]HZG87359.1 stage II sporulation protein D [Paenibacillus sp.]
MRISGSRMRRKRRTALWGAAGVAALVSAMLVIPGILVNRFEAWEPAVIAPLQPKEQIVEDEASASIVVPVFVTGRKEVVKVPLEQYVRGVLAAEMPADFELEALKAQAIAARTYLARRLAAGGADDMPPEAQGAIVTDTVAHQAYITEEALRAKWGWFAYARNLDKLTQAVNETAGLILTYDGEPIQAAFFSTSNGYTENSESYWQAMLPYLRSVESPWDAMYAPNYERKVTVPYQELYKKLGLKGSAAAPKMTLLESSESGRVLSVRIAGRTFTGREVREKLGLASTDFKWTVRDGLVEFRTEGYGHGVGMSQWGANGMAKQGKTAEEILLHYYTGVKIEPLDDDLAKRASRL